MLNYINFEIKFRKYINFGLLPEFKNVNIYNLKIIFRICCVQLNPFSLKATFKFTLHSRDTVNEMNERNMHVHFCVTFTGN